MIFFYFFAFADLLFVGFWLCLREIIKSENLGFFRYCSRFQCRLYSFLILRRYDEWCSFLLIIFCWACLGFFELFWPLESD